MVNKHLRAKILDYFLTDIDFTDRSPDVMFLPNIWRERMGFLILSWEDTHESSRI